MYKNDIMTEEYQNLSDMNTEDFNNMREMLSIIEMKIMQLPPLKQREFYFPLKRIIFMAWEDAIDSENEFLYKQTFKETI